MLAACGPLQSNPVFALLQQADVPGITSLINSGSIDVNLKDSYGYSVLMHAALGGNVKLVKNLIDLGADPLSKNEMGQTVLMTAAAAGQFDIVKHLLGAGVSIDQMDLFGRTAASYATEFGHDTIVATFEEHVMLPVAPHYSNPDQAFVLLLGDASTCVQTRALPPSVPPPGKPKPHPANSYRLSPVRGGDTHIEEALHALGLSLDTTTGGVWGTPSALCLVSLTVGVVPVNAQYGAGSPGTFMISITSDLGMELRRQGLSHFERLVLEGLAPTLRDLAVFGGDPAALAAWLSEQAITPRSAAIRLRNVLQDLITRSATATTAGASTASLIGVSKVVGGCGVVPAEQLGNSTTSAVAGGGQIGVRDASGGGGVERVVVVTLADVDPPVEVDIGLPPFMLAPSHAGGAPDRLGWLLAAIAEEAGDRTYASARLHYMLDGRRKRVALPRHLDMFITLPSGTMLYAARDERGRQEHHGGTVPSDALETSSVVSDAHDDGGVGSGATFSSSSCTASGPH